MVSPPAEKIFSPAGAANVDHTRRQKRDKSNLLKCYLFDFLAVPTELNGWAESMG
jgi:hypothetical protein